MPLVTLVRPGHHILWNLPEVNMRHFTVTFAVWSLAGAGRGWQGQRLRSLGEGLAGAKTCRMMRALAVH